jgi:hypothetical protein
MWEVEEGEEVEAWRGEPSTNFWELPPKDNLRNSGKEWTLNI